MPESRRSGSGTMITTALKEMPAWMRAVMFVAGVVGFLLMLLWFVLIDKDPEHQHTLIEFAFAGGMAAGCLFLVFPKGFSAMATRLLKIWKGKKE